jgi:hypothetical protein
MYPTLTDIDTSGDAPSNVRLEETSFRNNLPTPPNSTRTSLEQSQCQPTSPFHSETPQVEESPIKVNLPPSHLTPPPSPSGPAPATCDSILMYFSKVADREVTRVVVQDVLSSTYEAVVEKATNNGDWQAVRCDISLISFSSINVKENVESTIMRVCSLYTAQTLAMRSF